jgi:hypothetical protein
VRCWLLDHELASLFTRVEIGHPVKAGATSPIAMVVLQKPTIGSRFIFFLARNHFFNLVRKPNRIAMI